MAPRRLNPCSYLPRRLQIVTSLALFVVLCIVFFGNTSYEVPYAENIQETAQGAAKYLPKQLPKLPSAGSLNPFRAPAHAPPPEQANSTSGEARWFSDFKWMNPFSSSITLDENRAVLPPLNKRPPIYTFYDTEWDKDEDSKDATHRLLLIWRRAWWAQGFRPIVLGRAEAINNPLYRKLQNLELEAELENDLMRWLAWGNMGNGILVNWLVLPMAPHTDPLLSFLRRGVYPDLTRYEGLESGLFTGGKDSINKAIQTALDLKQPIKGKSLVDVAPDDTFKVDPQHDGIAFYSTVNIVKKYKGISEKLMIKDGRAEGLHSLAQLITSHLHMTWQNTFSSGIAVLNPLPDHSTHLVKPAVDLARNLSQCTTSPYPASCPPNKDRCQPCVSSHPMLISQPSVFRNTSTLFTIGTVPHPYTFASLQHQTEALTIRFIRRQTQRDTWIIATTKELLGIGLSSFARLIHVKDAIASDYGSSHSLWLTAEYTDSETYRKDLAWTFGFPVPSELADDGKSETPVPGPERRPPPPKPEGKVPDHVELMREKTLLDKARAALKNNVRQVVQIRDVVEAWNLADTEIWRFTRAYNARRRVERLKWEEEESGYAGSEGSKGVWGRWFDRRESEDSF
ncbi:hypothetical protein AAFC00_002075 [Neodothiora populina]|uniref:Uncharacterized protein n=1 Tax=Neodothiora populina TaxID=2781224 RepID=A0ABR3PHD2_9PEZI